jgi:hypothetical protein
MVRNNSSDNGDMSNEKEHQTRRVIQT